MMPSDEVIVRRLLEILEGADLAHTSVNAIRKQLEAEFGVSLISKKPFLRTQIDTFLKNRDEKSGSDDNDEEGSGACERDKKPVDRHLEGDSKRFKAKLKRAIKQSMPKEKASGKRGGFHKLCKLSPELAAVIGKEESSRPEVVKALWSYIREHGLQVPEDKRIICPDDLLRKVLGKDRVDMFAMNKLISKHIYTDTHGEAGDGAEEENSEANAEDDDDEPKAKKPKAEEQKAKGSSLGAATRISSELRHFLGTNEAEVSRQQAIKLMWQYIKTNQLQDPSNKKMILCDSKLEELFDCKSFSGFKDMPRLLKVHFLAADE